MSAASTPPEADDRPQVPRLSDDPIILARVAAAFRQMFRQVRIAEARRAAETDSGGDRA